MSKESRLMHFINKLTDYYFVRKKKEKIRNKQREQYNDVFQKLITHEEQKIKDMSDDELLEYRIMLETSYIFVHPDVYKNTMPEYLAALKLCAKHNLDILGFLHHRSLTLAGHDADEIKAKSMKE